MILRLEKPEQLNNFFDKFMMWTKNKDNIDEIL